MRKNKSDDHAVPHKPSARVRPARAHRSRRPASTAAPRPRRCRKDTGECGLRDVTRHIPHPIQTMLWGKAAGRCEFAGCNQPLYKSSVTQEQVNVAEKAHIFAFSAGGPRGNAELTDEEINDLANLMLVCHDCHRKIDQNEDGGRYTAVLLQQMKAQHEQRIERVTGIEVNRRSHVLLYGANIGAHCSPLTSTATEPHVFPERYPAEAKPIELAMQNSSLQDHSPEFWAVEERQLLRMFDRRVRERQADGSIEHLSVFALAPQPLLILLGSLLTDLSDTDVFQLHKEPKSWAWGNDNDPPEFLVEEPRQVNGPPALVLALSATIDDERIHAVLGSDAAIWKVTVQTPHNDMLRSRAQLQRFRQLMRPLMDRIKHRHGQNALLHVFPAAPVATCVELGRIRMPKADLPWHIYDQVNARGGFVPAIKILSGAA